MQAGDVLTAQFDLGNTSPVRKRVSVLIHQWDFGDLAACSFWLEPGAPMRTYSMRMHATTDWTDAALSVDAETRGLESRPGRSARGSPVPSLPMARPRGQAG